MSVLTKFFGRTVSEGAAYAAGLATGPVLRPVTREVESEIWKLHPDKPIDAEIAAAIVAEAVELQDWGANEAKSNGIDGDRFDALVREALTAPGLETLYAALRRNLISKAQFVHGLRKAKLETEWDTPLEGLQDVLLTPQELAAMQQQGFVDDARANSEAGLQGVTAERQQLLFAVNGLPPGVAEALTMLRRGIIDEATFAQIIREGHTKTKYTASLLKLKDVVLSATQYVEARVRGWIPDAAMYAGGALTGHSQEQMDLLFKIHGRPLSWHQIWIGLQRGGAYGGPVDALDPAFLKGLQESDIRPEWYNLAWHSRYSYPSAFVLRALATGGDLTQAQVEQILTFEGWEPGLAKLVSTKWTATQTVKADPWVTKAHGQLWTALHKAYVGETTYDDAKAKTYLTHVGASAAAQTEILSTWVLERDA